VRKYGSLLRIKHYIKNLLVFLPLLFSGGFRQGELLIRSVGGFLAFCAVSSCVYIINDIFDRENDRNHSTKKHRPIASGAVSVRAAVFLAVCMTVLAGLLEVLVVQSGWMSLLLGLYLLLNIGYSLGLKQVPLVDVVILASGYVIRVFYGGAVVGAAVSSWLYLTILFFSLFLGLGKRRNELLRQGDQSRAVLKHYPPAFLDRMMYMCLTLTVVFYSFWCIDPEVAAQYSPVGLTASIPLLVLVFMKYVMAVEGASDGDPVEVLLHDKALLALCGAYALLMGILVWMR
jgi:decaprenyl-phosphate phosphoribosyltransferase